MAQLLLTVGGNVAGAAIGGPIGAAVGGAIGNAVGGMIDAALFPGPVQRVQGPRLSSLDVALPAEGAHLPWVAGWARLPAKMIWRTPLEEVATTQRSGGKGAPAPRAEATSFSYFGNALFALCEGGPRLHFGRVWADARPFDAAKHGVRFYRGDVAQMPDACIEALEGIGATPAYRDVALMMVERLPLGPYGDRWPNVHVEVCNPVGDMEPMIRGLTLIPGNEWGLATTPIRQEVVDASGDVVRATVENSNRSEAETDFTVAARQITELCENLETATLVLTWFGTDLRAGECEILPKVEIIDKKTSPLSWVVDGVTRGAAQAVSLVDGRPAFGSTPADAAILEGAAALQAKGLGVIWYPFIQMDVAPGNGLPDPYGAPEQAAFAWRGRITSTGDGTAAAAADVEAFFNRPNGYRRFILHMARLAAQAGGAAGFCIGSELRGLTWLRDGGGAYVTVARLRALAAEVRAILGPGVKIGYAADWSEYFGHQPGDGSGDVFFHLDPLWADENIDFVGIDDYMPLADWRDGVEHLDAAAGSIHSLDYLRGNVEGGEGFEWFYASAADRAAQARTPITDGAHAEPWVFRYKDIRAWWSNPHHNRPGGVRDAAATAWVPQSKPIWFTEVGCPAVDKGANQPNVFIDDKSSESAAPYFSDGRRDDFMQRRFLEAKLGYWEDPAHNPISAVYGGRMIDTARTAVWTADTRPWPEYPDRAALWADYSAYRAGHWVRLGRAPLAETLRAWLARDGVSPADLELALAHGQVDGVATDRAMSFREFLTPWEAALRVDAFETFGKLAFQSRAAAPAWGAVTPGDLVEAGDASPYTLTRSSIQDPPREAVIRFVDSGADWQTGAARATIQSGAEDGLAEASLGLGMDLERADAIAGAWLRDVTESREGLEFTAPPSWADLEAGRPFLFTAPGQRPRAFMVESVTRGAARKVTARSFDQVALRGGLTGPDRPPVRVVNAAAAPPLVAFMDLPRLSAAADPAAGYVAAHAEPWLGVTVWRAPEQSGPYAPRLTLGARTPLGRLDAPLAAAPADRWTPGPAVVRLFAGELLTATEADVLAGANALAVEAAQGEWEVLQFARAELTGPRTWTLRQLLRGRLGTEAAAALGADAGARVVALGLSVAQPAMTAADIGRAWWWRSAPVGADVAGDLAVERVHAFQGVGLRPFAPYAVRAEAQPDGGALVAWLRRSREPGQPWRTPPLAEEAERYLVRIRPEGGGAAVREAEATAPAWTYPAADRAADALGASFMVEVAQISATFGPGGWARAVVTV